MTRVVESGMPKLRIRGGRRPVARPASTAARRRSSASTDMSRRTRRRSTCSTSTTPRVLKKQVERLKAACAGERDEGRGGLRRGAGGADPGRRQRRGPTWARPGGGGDPPGAPRWARSPTPWRRSTPPPRRDPLGQRGLRLGLPGRRGLRADPQGRSPASPRRRAAGPACWWSSWARTATTAAPR